MTSLARENRLRSPRTVGADVTRPRQRILLAAGSAGGPIKERRMNPDVLIIGGGIIGISTAYYLAREGIAVTVIEKGNIGSGSSYGNAGLICPCHSTPRHARRADPGLEMAPGWRKPFLYQTTPRPRFDQLAVAVSFLLQPGAFDTAVPILRDMQRASLDFTVN